MKRQPKLFLWVSLISSISILFESVTGLITEKPQWFGGQAQPQFNMQNFKHGRYPSFNQGNSNTNSSQGAFPSGSGNTQSGGYAASHSNPPTTGNRSQGFSRRNFAMARNGSGNTLSGFMQQLHRGYINGVNLSWLMMVFAIILILVSVYGIYMSIKLLFSKEQEE